MTGSRSQSVKELKELIEIPLKHPELYDNMGIPPPKAVLLYGVTGVGKTHLIRKATNRANARLVSLKLETTTANNLLDTVKTEVSKSKPIVFYLVMHNPDAIHQEIISVLTKILDGDFDLDLEQVIFAGSTIRPSFPRELTRPGRFDRELEISLPNEKERWIIIKEIIVDSNVSPDVDLKKLATKCRGYTPADLLHLMKTAARIAIRNKFSDNNDNKKRDATSTIEIDRSDFEKALEEIKPTVYQEMGFTKPNITWKELAGHTQIKNSIEQKVIEPLRYREYFEKAEVTGIRGILLYGPPGNGKTTLAKAITTGLDAHFIYINASDFIGSSSSNLELAQIFDVAGEVEPTVIFIDEADSMLLKRENAKEETIILINEFLSLLDGRDHESRTLVIAATNFIDKIDEAVKRPGRLEMQLFVGPPSIDERKEVFKLLTRTKNLSKSIDFEYLSKLTEPTEEGYYSFSDLVAIVREAGTMAAQEVIKRNLDPKEVKFDNHHFEQVIEQYKPSISVNSLLKFMDSKDNSVIKEPVITPNIISALINSMNNEDKLDLYIQLKEKFENNE